MKYFLFKIKNVIAILLLLTITQLSIAQTDDNQITSIPIGTVENTTSDNDRERKSIWRNSVGDKFEDVQKKMEEYYEDRDKGRGSGYKQWKRWEADMMIQLLPNGTIPNLATLYTKENRKIEQATKKSLSGNWQNIGPDDWVVTPGGYAPGTGRINRIAFHKVDPAIIYVGAARGGVWRTRDYGKNWTPLFQTFANIGVSGIGLGTTNPDLVYVLSGDGDAGGASAGVYKSLDAGESWTITTLPWAAGTNVVGFKLLVDPTDDDIVYVVTNNGLFKTDNGGDDWSLRRSGNWRDMEFKPGDPNYLILGGVNNYIYFDGTNWLGNTFSNNPRRVEIAVTPDNPDLVYLILGNGYNAGTGSSPDYRHAGLLRSLNGGLNYTYMSTSPNIVGGHESGQDSLDQADYDLAIIAKNDDANTVLVGGVNLWGSTNSGSAFSNYAHWAIGLPPNTSLPYVHADIHDLAQNPLDDKLYCASDGGIFVSDDFGLTWTDLSKGINIGMYYRIDNVDGTDRVIMGAQDNGSMYSDNNDGTMNVLWGADGMDCQIADDDPNKMLYSDQNGGLFRTFNSGLTLNSIKPSISNGVWTTPVDLDPTNSDRIATAYRDTVYVSDDFGSNWDTIPFPTAGLFESVHFTDAGNLVVARQTSIYTIDASNNVTNITLDLPLSNPITRIGSMNSELFVVIGGNTAGDKVYGINANSPTSWFNLSHNLPNVPMFCIDEDPITGRIYVGHALGVHVYYTSSPGSWASYSNGVPNQSLPNTNIRDIEVNVANGTVYASAWGRGLYMSELQRTVPPNDLMANAIEIDCFQGFQVGTTTEATDTDFPGHCGDVNINNAPGVWYKITGTGYDITLNLCGASHDSQLTIWEDVAGTLTCVDGEDDDDTACDGELDPSITWTSAYNTVYYAYVYGYNGDVGDFTIDIECEEPPCTVVTNSNDDGGGSLRAAVACANPGDVITFHPSTDGNPIMLTSAQIVADKSLTFEGNGEDATIIDGIGNDAVRLMYINSGAPCNFRDMRFQNGGGENFTSFGGAIYFWADSKFTNCTFNNNEANAGGALASAFCGATITGCEFYENEANQSGALDLFPQPTHSSTITNSLFHHNTSGNIGAIRNGGTSTGGLFLYNNTIADNTSTGGSAAGIQNENNIINLMNNIIANNTSPSGSQVFNFANGSIGNVQKNIISDLTGSGLNASTDANPVDPNFIDAANYDYHLASPSPGINAGNNGNLQVDICDVDGDGNVAEVYPFDLDGTVRVLHGNVDLGALETDEACDITTDGLTIIDCDDQGTADPSDDTYTFQLDPTGNGLGFQYDLAGGIAGSTATYGLPVTFTRPISLGPITYTITDKSGGCTFEGTVTPPAPCSPLPGETCEDPIPIACGQTVTGDNTGLQVTISPNCHTGSGDFFSRKIWYSFTGDGSVIQLNLSSQFIDIGMIYSQSCGNLVCEGSFGSSINFQTTNGVDYLVMISGFDSNQVGAFSLDVNCCVVSDVSTVEVSETSVEVTWNTGSLVSSTMIEVCPDGITQGDPSCTIYQNVTSPFSVDNLILCNVYDLFLEGDCSGESTDLVSISNIQTSIPVNLNPSCAETATYPTCGNGALYDNDELFSYTVCPVNATDIVEVTFTYFDLEVDDGFGCYDFIEVTDVASSTSFGQFCSEADGSGDMPPAANDLALNPTFTASSPGTCLTITFDSDGSSQETGFSFDVTCIPGTDPCEEDITLVSPDDDIAGGAFIISTNKSIFATNKITGTSGVDYVGGSTQGESINLNGGFEVGLNAVFHAYMDGCVIPAREQSGSNPDSK